MDLWQQLVAFLGTINPTYAAIAGVILFLFRDKLPALPKLPLINPGPVPEPKAPADTPLLDWLRELLKKKFKDLKDAGADDHEAAIHLAGTLKAAGIKIEKQ